MKKVLLFALVVLIFQNLEAQKFTFGTIPDTQNLTENDEDVSSVHKITEWYAANSDSLNLSFVASLGDMTQYGATDQWQRIRKSYNTLKNAGIPYAPCQGNHDPHLDTLNLFFPVSEFEKTETFGGYLHGMENAYYLFSEGNHDFIVVVIQSHDQFIGPYDTLSVNWANKILNKYSDRHAIFVTHDFFERRNLVADVITKHDNIFLAVCGHSCAREEYWTEKSPNGRTINCIMSDYQCDEDKGATLRYYTFNAENKTIEAFTYNIPSETYEVDSNSQFTFAYPEPLLKKPVVTNIQNLPVFPKSNESVNISATVFDKTQITEAYLLWGDSENELDNKVKLFLTGTKLNGEIPANADKSIIYYQIIVENILGEQSTLALNSYEICDDGSCLVCPFITTQNPYHGKPITIPGKIEAEEYNKGCINVAYFDTDEGNLGNAYRNGGVDVEHCSEGGYSLGWTVSEEWLNYQVNVPEEKDYTFNFRVASNWHGSVIHVEVDGVDISGPINIENTGNWRNWVTLSKSDIRLKQGVQNIRIVIDKGGFNFNYFSIENKG